MDSDERLVITALQDEENMPFRNEYKKDLKRLLNTKVKRVSTKTNNLNSQQVLLENTGSHKNKKMLSEKSNNSQNGSFSEH